MKIVWYGFGIILLIMAVSNILLIMNLSCLSYGCGYSYGYDNYGSYNLNYDCGYDYDSYYYCRHFRNGYILKTMIYFFGSMWCFALGSIE